MPSMHRVVRLFVLLVLFPAALAAQPQRWSEQKAADWYKRQPWLVGSNYCPPSAINELEMWQADTFDPKRIDLELGWAAGLGMNTMRVFLHDLLWQQDAEGFKKRLDTFLGIAAKHRIRPMFVLFDSVWDPNPQLGKQRAPAPRRAQLRLGAEPRSRRRSADPAEHARLEAYVKGVVGAFARDERVLAWDIWNEPDNLNTRQLRQAGAEEQGRPRAGAAAEDVRLGARGRPAAAADGRGVEGRLVEPGEDDARSIAMHDRAVRRRHVPQLRLARPSSSSGSTG